MDDDFDINFSLLPPKLQLHLWILGLDANTSKVNIAYQNNSFRTALSYNYGGNIQASLAIRRFSARVGVSPSNGNVDLGLVFRGYKFNVSGSVQLQQQTFSLNINYGAGLFPFPDELRNTFNQGGMAAVSIMGDLNAARNNPLVWYNLHSNDASAISNAISMAQRIKKIGNSPHRIGAGLRLNYNPRQGFVIYAGINLRF